MLCNTLCYSQLLKNCVCRFDIKLAQNEDRLIGDCKLGELSIMSFVVQMHHQLSAEDADVQS